MITQGLSRRRVLLATAGTMLALLLAALDQTIVGTAIPRIVADLNGLDRLAWVTTAYLVTSTTMTPIAGKLGDLFGRKPFLLAGMIGFVAASALCGLSQDMTQLIVFRGIQGIFGGVLFATVFTVIGDLFPPENRGRVQGLFGGVFGLSSIVGPTAGGFITDHWSWRWVFEVNIPVGVIAVLVVLAGFLTAFGMFGSILFTPLVFQGVLGISATNSGALITPMMFGLLAASTITGFAMRRIKYYRYLGTLGVAVMIGGMYLLSLITPSMPEWRVVAALIVVGLGIGTTFPLYLTAVQVALPRQYLGVASSQIQFWRNLGGTVGSSILGAVLANRLPGYLTARTAALHLPPQVIASLPKTGANAILQPGALSQLPPAVATAIRLALSDTLHDIYIFAGAILIAALIATVFLKEVPLTSAPSRTGFAEPVPENDAAEEAREKVPA